MTPMPNVPEPFTPRQAAERLYTICDDLALRQVSAETVAEIRDLSQRFTRHFQELPVFCQRLEQIAQGMRA